MENKSSRLLIVAVGIALMSAAVMTAPVNKNQVSEEVDTVENTTEAVITMTETTAVMTTKITTTTSATTITELPRAVDLDLTEEDEWSFNNRSKFIYFTEEGCYYPVEIGGRQSANYVLCFEDLKGNQTIFEETEDYSSYYFDGNAVYLTTYGEITPEEKFIPVYKYHKLENGELVTFKESEESIIPYFTEDYIYYKNTTYNGTEIRRMDYNFENDEAVIGFGENEIYLYDFIVYDNKIWYNYSDGSGSKTKYPSSAACLDLQTGETTNFDDWFMVGRINNGYMYYVYGENSEHLNRVNLQTGEPERVVDAEWLSDYNYDFYEDYILYSAEGDMLCKYNGEESEVVFTPDDIHPGEGFWLNGVQCQDGRIFVEIGSGAFYEEIVEVDIDGNILNIIPEEPKENMEK